MSISSVSASPPVNIPETAAPQASAQNSTTNADVNTVTWQPPAQAPLPPGQGTRVNQLA